MNALEKLNKYTYRIDGDLKEFTPWHLSALKAAIAIELNAPCSEDCLFDALELSVKLFGASKTQVQFGSTVIDKNSDDLLSLISEYHLAFEKNRDTGRYRAGYSFPEFAKSTAWTHTNDCPHIAITECIAALPEHLLVI